MCKKGVCILFVVFFVALSLESHGQVLPSARQKMAAISAYNRTRMPEKLFVHTDKWNYNKGDTLWFKTYVFDATLSNTIKTGLMYIEIVDADNNLINRNMVSLNDGVGWGNMILKSTRYTEGTYTMRAYTNWMRNFDEHYMFSRQFTIEGALDENWMINSKFELTDKDGKNNVKSNLTFVKDNGSPMFAEQLEVFIDAGKRRLFRTKLTTGVDGGVDFNFNLPEKVSANDINITLYKTSKEDKVVKFNVPVIINRDEKTDVQFMPEGGNLITGLNNRVAFKAINEEGKGVNLSGDIYNSKGQKMADIATIHKGMGLFELKPDLNEKYTAKVNYNGKDMSFALPNAKPSGLVMHVDNTINKDSIIITVTPSADVKQLGAVYHLTAQSRHVVCYGVNVNTGNNTVRLSAPKAAFPTGVARFTLLSPQNQPVAERIVYVDHNDQIKLLITPSKPNYANRDSVNLQIMATDKDGVPLVGSFSLTVTDDAQARPDTSGYFDMPAKVLLADDLKGYVENPGWYFTKGNKLKKAAALDALMLTQGWVKYDWQDVFAPKQKQVPYKPETEFIVKGKVTNVFNKELEKTDVLLIGTKPALVLQTETDANGEFAFTGLTPPDTVVYLVQAKNKRGNAFNVDAKVNEYVAPIFTNALQRTIPLYVNIDTARLSNIRTTQKYNLEDLKLSGTQLNEVQIKAKKVVKDSKVLVEEPDFTLNREDIKEMGKVTLLNMLKKIPGFNFFPSTICNPDLKIDGKTVVIIIDGMRAGVASAGLCIGDLLNHTYNDDIKGIEVMTSGKNQIAYSFKFDVDKYLEKAFIEITTYSGHGITKQIPGSFLYQPPSFAPKKEFYSPRYAVKKDSTGLDYRATIFWAPSVITDNKGKATISFYTADKPGTYTVNMQGADMQGLIGAQQIKLNVKAGADNITAK